MRFESEGTRGILLFFTAAILLVLGSCPKPMQGEIDPTPPVVYRYTFEPSTPIGTWLSNGAVFPQTENNATGGLLATENSVVKTGSGSLEVSATLPAGTDVYTSCAAFFKLHETLGIGPSVDFSLNRITASLYSPAPPAGGGDYIQIVLRNGNGNGSVVLSKAFMIATYGEWMTVTMDLPDYLLGTETWGYFNYQGGDDTADDVYGCVTQIGVKIGFTDGPDRAYEYYIDDVVIEQSPTALPLRYVASARGKKIGAAVWNNFSEPGYGETLAGEFNTLVAENSMKWAGLHTEDNTYNYSSADTLTAFAAANDMSVRGHCLLWHHPSQRPAWLETIAAGYTGAPDSALEAELKEHIDSVIAHFGNSVYAWDVVNEVIIDPWINPDPPDYSEAKKALRNKTRSSDTYEYSFWAANAEDDYLLKKAFEFAHDKLVELGIRDQVKLFACDYTNEQMGTAKGDQFFKLVEQWVDAGVQIDGVGFQLHLSFQWGMPNYTSIRNNIERFSELKPGFEVHFSEVDIAIYAADGVSQSELDAQALAYKNLGEIWRESPEVTSFLTWGITDKHSWLNSGDWKAGLLFDEAYASKPGYYSLKNALLR